MRQLKYNESDPRIQESFTPLGLVPREYDKTHPKIQPETPENTIGIASKKIQRKSSVVPKHDHAPHFSPHFCLPIFRPHSIKSSWIQERTGTGIESSGIKWIGAQN
jgi:hypothetical protein